MNFNSDIVVLRKFNIALSAKVFHSKEAFRLESGEVLPSLQIAYHTYGSMNEDGSNVVWVCHALTANSDVADWWTGLIGHGKVIDPARHFIVCANVLGSCYGTSGPQTINPATGEPWYRTFPTITIRDIVQAHELLRQHLQIQRIHLLIGGSMGGYQVLEWALIAPEVIERLFLLCTGAAESAWGIAIHTAQRLAIEADETWQNPAPDAGSKGLKAARAIGMLTYRNYRTFVQAQTDPDKEKTDNFRASSYINYQGEKLVKRFNAQSYWLLTKAMDSHNIARGRHEKITTTLSHIKQPALLIGISSDILCPPEEQQFMATFLPNATYHEIDSSYGHDGFLIEFEKIGQILKSWDH
ncbi:homoserine O-acetyltransferase [Chitinophaga terrae (ex Kim and Jung 2007)]|uniref:homoserine O-acetyltransferase MetX n=1 Tax=Chitinophaga terrae (ex Kim and Jung 2007) TaxID=408074 RepID=UPI002788EEC6|nr:homoserine O-acetyltransferase [Chitinophaga terrae (ex Kim and Jung 2007)]MDQ0110075.1 homoserine O-acetyltransferase [Chitinophaga terrae (ex Kim and Jung 2007)]